ncbi:MAG: DUF4097 domain-containing protein, partial [Oscillospiraceae bacterium]|nr:DUF4097 domain-containing protein [Oscillospiraceae bacterium]
MNKALIVICMIITAAAAIGIIFIMILGLNGHTLSSFNVNVGYGWGESMLIKEETFSIKDIRRFSLESGSYGVYVRAVDGVTASVRQYSNHSDSPFTMDKTGSEVSVNARQNGVSIGLFFIWNRRIEIDIPRSWAGDVNFTTSSGGLTLEDNFKWAVASLQASSGGINIKYPLTTESLSLRASSGGIRISDGLTAGKQIQIRATSGGVRADG